MTSYPRSIYLVIKMEPIVILVVWYDSCFAEDTTIHIGVIMSNFARRNSSTSTQSQTVGSVTPTSQNFGSNQAQQDLLNSTNTEDI